ncbi:hypothetical protein EVG20_g6942 [Dentipellis fragilis]|uniref:Transmembrane protein n=1 Tax=Dentipellis fragilis TaxID=205917 RepID=A0A4Y9YHY9_9AGAM|nr:hypothetical protein EVG20_g6942 [Dentipellis fragilis]
MPLQIDVAELGGLVGESILYGMYLILLTFATYLYISRWKSGENVPWPIPVFAGLMFLLATAQIVTDTWNVFVAFFHHATRAERMAYLEDVTQNLFAWKHSVLIVMLFVGDGLVVCLTSTSCESSLLMLRTPPALSMLYNMGKVGMDCSIPNPVILRKYHLGANAISTILLAGKIWQHDRATRRVIRVTESALTPILRIVIESGAMNATYLLVWTLTLATKSQALETMAEMATVMFALISTLLILRVQLNADREKRYTTRPFLSDFRATNKAPPALSQNLDTVYLDQTMCDATNYTSGARGSEETAAV